LQALALIKIEGSQMLIRSTLAICAAVAYLTLCAHAPARQWEALYTFGDSYTDSGAGYLDTNPNTRN
jgi:hypothetical protein